MIDPSPQFPTAATAAAPAPVSESPKPDATTITLPTSELPIAPSSLVSPFFIIVCLILALLIGAGIAGTMFLRNRANSRNVEETVAGSSSGAVPDSIRFLNLGSYPGATPVAIATLSGDTIIAGFLTKDTPAQVMQYYKVRFPVSSATTQSGKAQLSSVLPSGERIRIDAEAQGGGTRVMIVQEH